MKLSPAGQVLFSTFVGGPKSDFGNAIVVIDGVPIIGGTSDGDGFVQRGPSRRVTFGGKAEEKLTGMAHHGVKLYATGYTKSDDWKKLRGPSDAFVVRLNAQTLEWRRSSTSAVAATTRRGVLLSISGVPCISRVKLIRRIFPGRHRGFQKKNHGGVDASSRALVVQQPISAARRRTRPAMMAKT